MSEKRKRDQVTESMRLRLMSNRNGRLTKEQWLDMITDPLVTLLLLAAPLLLVLGPRLAMRSGLMVLLILVVVLLVPTLLRARRYARAAVHFSVLYASPTPRPPWMFWRPQVFYDETQQPVRFTRRLAPYMWLRPEHAYLAYYLIEPGGNVLLSLAPADHPDAERWYPTKIFETRFSRRSTQGS